MTLSILIIEILDIFSIIYGIKSHCSTQEHYYNSNFKLLLFIMTLKKIKVSSKIINIYLLKILIRLFDNRFALNL